MVLGISFALSAFAQGSATKTLNPAPSAAPEFVKPDPATDATLTSIDFEAETSWTFNFTPWTVVDNDGLPTYGMTGYTWPNSGDPQAYIVFEPATTDPPITDDPEILPHGGDKFGACMAAVPDGGQGNNDWFISGQVAITDPGASFSFYAKSYTDQYGLEKFKVGVSTTGNSPSDFTIISGSSPIEAPVAWTQYSYGLSSYVGQSIYVAIQCVSYDAFIFMIDDLEIDPDGGGGGGNPTCDDFDNLSVGDYVAVELSDWTTWSGSPGSSEDAQVTDATASTSPNSFAVEGSTDLVKLFSGSTLSSGEYSFTTEINVASGYCGYFNLQKDVSAGVEWGFEVQFDADGTATVNAGASSAATFTYTQDAWHSNELIIDLDANWAEYWFDGSLIVDWQWSLGANGTPGATTLGGANFYAWASTGNSPLAYFDDVCFDDITVFEPDIFVNPDALTISLGGTTKGNAKKPDHSNWENQELTGDYLPGKIIIRLRDDVEVDTDNALTGSPAVNALNQKFHVKSMAPVFMNNDKNTELKKKFGLPYIYELHYSGAADILELLKAYSALEEVLYAEPDYIYRTCAIPPDPMYPDQWGMNNTGQAIPYGGGGTVGTPGADINAELAWDIQTGSSSIIVSVIDEGVDLSHPEFSGRLLPGYDFYDNDPDPSPEGDGAHGTACAGIVGAASDGVGVVGVTWNVTILPVRVLGPGGGSNTQVSNGITFSADEGADVLSMSLGGTSYSSTMEAAVDYAFATDAIILSAAGNDNVNNSTTPHYPAEYANSISVGALSPCNDRKSPSTCDGESWWGSNYGGSLDFMAPGVRIFTTDISGSAGYSSTNYTSTFNGTSSACPSAAGVAALIRSENPGLSNQQVWDIMQNTCVDLESPGYDTETGYGRLDAYQALLSAGGTPTTNVFNIMNVGNSTLTVTSITDDKNWLSTSGYSTPPFDLSPGSGQDITVDVDWGLLGPVQQTGTITVASNDPDEPASLILVTAIPGPAPDLIVENAALDPATVNAGESTSATCDVVNDGDSLADARTLKYYLSEDTQWDDADTYLASDAVGSLAIGGSSPQIEELDIPPGTAAGDYYILFFADADSVVNESDEGNNMNYASLEISSTPPYLLVDPSIKNVSATQGYFEASVSSNVMWNVIESCDWLYCDPVSGQNSDVFAVIYQENTTGAIRSYTIEVSGEGQSDNLTVIQDYTISLEEHAFSESLKVYPNPFTKQLVVEYALAEQEEVLIRIFDPLGNIVYSVSQTQTSGEHILRWNASGLPAGIYYYSISAGEHIARGKVVKN